MCSYFRSVALMLMLLSSAACSLWDDLPPRPASVPADAVRLGGPEASWWVKCSYKSSTNVCTVFNSGGVVLYQESAYRPYDEGPPVPEHELRIDPRRSGIGVLYLQNGRILIFSRDFDSLKRGIDAQRGVRR